MKETLLITGAKGQLGSVLAAHLRQRFGNDRVVATDLFTDPAATGIYEILDATDLQALLKTIKKYSITQIYHMAAILSANGEADPFKTWNLNMNALFCVMDAACQSGVKKVFFPSSIAVYGTQSTKILTSQNAYRDAGTVYGISKLAGENWAQYYFNRYGLDIRSLRYPGVVSHQSMPGGGTTDYAVAIFHAALQNKPYNCYLKKDTRLPMIYIDDAIRAAIELMDAPPEAVKVRSAYNLAGISFTPEEIAAKIKKQLPEFEINYTPDFRQHIASLWPESINDTNAREDWGWKNKFDLDDTVNTMIHHLKQHYNSVKS